LARISKGEQSDLAQHQYLVAMIAWRLAKRAQAAGGSINIQHLFELALLHDVGELFGGDIAAPYARANPKARTAAKAFEAENQRFIAELFDEDRVLVQSLFDEERVGETDEAQIVKMADFIECTHYKRLVGRASDGDVILAKNVCEKRLALIQDEKTKTALRQLIDEWLAAFDRPDAEIFEAVKSVNHE